MKPWLFKAIAILTVLGVGGFLIAASGIMPIKASSGHWMVTEWLLHFAMRRSIATYSVGLEPPPLKDPGLVLKGAGHYDVGCRPCHGTPDLQPPPIVQRMTPPPPHLQPVIPSWSPEELFYIVKHGVKFTGMPAWPAQQRDDEVWAIVAFLLILPGLDADTYKRLITGEDDARGKSAAIQDLQGTVKPPQVVLENCERCHGVDGHGRGVGAFPALAGQQFHYLFSSLQAYGRKKRHSGIMGPIAAGLKLDEMHALAHYYGNLPAPSLPLSAKDDLAAIERGRIIATDGIPSQRVPGCVDCHGPGNAARNPAYPSLAGQYADYIVLQLELFKHQRRGGSNYAHLMRPVALRLTPEQMRDVALYYASVN